MLTVDKIENGLRQRVQGLAKSHPVQLPHERELALMQAVNSERFRVNYDACNFYIAGEEGYPRAYEILKDYIAYVHVKDGAKQLVAGDEGKICRLWQDESGDYLCVPFGEGAVNFDGLLRRLVQDGYDGFITLEPHLADEHLDEGISKTLDYLKRI